MATSHNKSVASVLFTLPLSCQICLGKVKQPALCSNYHVFCGTCINTWLERSHHCPSCRVPIDHNNPVRHIRGGLNQVEDEEETKSTPEMRKTRFELLYRDYEDTLERLEGEVKNLTLENSVLKSQLHSAQSAGASSGSKQGGSSQYSSDQQLQLLTGKLQDAQKLYDRVQRDIKKLKQENNSLKERNTNLTQENGKLREEISSRSPHKYGRLTVATLESQLESQRKEVQRLTKALERSDLYIEDLEQQLQTRTTLGEAAGKSATGRSDIQPAKDCSRPPVYRKSHADIVSSQLDFHACQERGDGGHHHPAKRQLFTSELHRENGATGLAAVPNGKGFGNDESKAEAKTESIMKKTGSGGTHGSIDCEELPVKKVQFKLSDKKSDDTSSFNLEAPSPIVPSSFSRLTLDSGVASDLLSGQSHKSRKSPDSSSSGIHEDLDFDFARPDSLAKDQRDFSSRRPHKPQVPLPASNASLDDSISHPRVRTGRGSEGQKKNGSFDLEGPSLDDTQTIRTELNDLDISVTPELSDCLKLLNRAEKKMHGTEVPLSNPPTRLPSWVPEIGLDRPTGSAASGTDTARGADGYKSLSAGGREMDKGIVGLLSEKLQGTSGTMSSWEHGFFSSLKVNPYKHTSSLSATSSSRDAFHGGLAQPHTSLPAAQAASAGSSHKSLSSHDDFKRPLSRYTPDADQPSRADPINSKELNLPSYTHHGAAFTSALPNPLPASTSSALSGLERLSSAQPPLAASSLSSGLSSTRFQPLLASASSSGVSHLDADLVRRHLDTDSVPSHIPPQGRKDLLSDYQGSAGQAVWPSKTQSSKDYSYISNLSSVGADSNNLDSYLPEPKKRLFDSADELDIGSPTKTTKIV